MQTVRRDTRHLVLKSRLPFGKDAHTHICQITLRSFNRHARLESANSVNPEWTATVRRNPSQHGPQFGAYIRERCIGRLEHTHNTMRLAVNNYGLIERGA